MCVGGGISDHFWGNIFRLSSVSYMHQIHQKDLGSDDLTPPSPQSTPLLVMVLVCFVIVIIIAIIIINFIIIGTWVCRVWKK